MLTATEVPTLLQRSHIKFGYRPMHQPKTYYYKSAFTCHNELLNFWTHGLPIVYLLFGYMLPEFAREQMRFPAMLMYGGILILLIGSSMAHLLHSRSAIDHIFWFLIDFAGIAVFSLCIGLQRYACATDMPLWADILYLPSLLLVVIVGQNLTTCWLFVHRPYWNKRHLIRLVTCLLLAIWVNIPLMTRYLSTATLPDPSLSLHKRAFIWLLVSGIFMGANVPERWSPGTFDLVGYGHQIFHVCILMVSWNLLDAADIDSTAASASWWSVRNVAVTGALGTALLLILHTLRTLMKIAGDKKYY